MPSRKSICTFTVDSAGRYKRLRCWGEFAFMSSLEVLSPHAAPLPSGHAEGTLDQGKEQGPASGKERRGGEGRSRARGWTPAGGQQPREQKADRSIHHLVGTAARGLLSRARGSILTALCRSCMQRAAERKPSLPRSFPRCLQYNYPYADCKVQRLGVFVLLLFLFVWGVLFF